MDVELSRTFPVPRKKGFEYVMDVGTWAAWSPFSVAEPAGVKWEKKRDLVEFAYRTPLGFPVTGAARLKKVVADELIGLTLMMPGIPDLPLTLEFAHAGPGAFTLMIKVHVEEPESFWAGRGSWPRSRSWPLTPTWERGMGSPPTRLAKPPLSSAGTLEWSWTRSTPPRPAPGSWTG